MGIGFWVITVGNGLVPFCFVRLRMGASPFATKVSFGHIAEGGEPLPYGSYVGDVAEGDEPLSYERWFGG